MSSWITTTPGIACWITPCQISEAGERDHERGHADLRDDRALSRTDGRRREQCEEDAEIPRQIGTVRSLQLATTTPAMPLTNEIERSISPIRSTKTTP